jgi:hypothetical protein
MFRIYSCNLCFYLFISLFLVFIYSIIHLFIIDHLIYNSSNSSNKPLERARSIPGAGREVLPLNSVTFFLIQLCFLQSEASAHVASAGCQMPLGNIILIINAIRIRYTPKSNAKFVSTINVTQVL